MNNKVKTVLVGYGKMGKTVHACAKNIPEIDIVSTIDHTDSKAYFKNINQESLKSAEVAICFSHASSVLDIVTKLCDLKVKIVMATTAWEEYKEDVKKVVTNSDGSLLYSANFSLGVLLFFEIVKNTCAVFNNFSNYDISAFEMHHNQKIDSPSGTLKKIGTIVLENTIRKTKLVENSLNRSLDENELHLGFARGGDISGIHTLLFDSEFDTIELKHHAKNRNGFAIGALMAAKWLKDKQGIFTEKEFLASLIASKK